MRQFQGSLGPIQDLQPKRSPAAVKPASEPGAFKRRASDQPRPADRSLWGPLLLIGCACVLYIAIVRVFL